MVLDFLVYVSQLEIELLNQVVYLVAYLVVHLLSVHVLFPQLGVHSSSATINGSFVNFLNSAASIFKPTFFALIAKSR